MRLLIFALCFSAALAQDEFISKVLTDPALSLRCKEMLGSRENKLEVKQKTQSLLARARGLLDTAPQSKQSIIKRLKVNKTLLERRLQIAELQVSSMEEEIIRSGCPGLAI